MKKSVNRMNSGGMGMRVSYWQVGYAVFMRNTISLVEFSFGAALLEFSKAGRLLSWVLFEIPGICRA